MSSPIRKDDFWNGSSPQEDSRILGEAYNPKKSRRSLVEDSFSKGNSKGSRFSQVGQSALAFENDFKLEAPHPIEVRKVSKRNISAINEKKGILAPEANKKPKVEKKVLQKTSLKKVNGKFIITK